jgi:beta-lactamase class A
MLTFVLLLALTPDLDRLTAGAGGSVGVAAVHLETGHRFGARERERFAMHSVFKLPIAIEVLAQVDAGTLDLDRPVKLVAADRRAGVNAGLGARIPTTLTVRELLETMLIDSDNTACDKLLGLLGGPAVVGARMARLGLPDIVVDRTEKELAAGRPGDTATPAALAELLEKLARGQLGLQPERAALLGALLGRTATGARRIKAGLPDGTPLQHKTGTSPTRNGITAATNDVGVITLPDGSHLVLAVLVRDARADEAAREATIAGVARAAYDWAVADRP